MGHKVWGQKTWITNYWLKRMKKPFPEPYSIRQAFYKELPEIMEFVPEYVKTNTQDWARAFYNKMTNYLSQLVLRGRASYHTINVYDDSGASTLIWQNYAFEENRPPTRLGFAEYPIEVWVENNATYNSLFPLFEWNLEKQSAEFQINLISQRGPAKTQQIEKLTHDRKDDVKVILNLTDFDPSGYDMPRDLASRCTQIGLDIEVKHIGIFPSQIPEERRQVSLIKYKKRDPNTRKFQQAFSEDPMVLKGYGYEIQALMPPELRAFTSKQILKVVNDYGFEKKE